MSVKGRRVSAPKSELIVYVTSTLFTTFFFLQRKSGSKFRVGDDRCTHRQNFRHQIATASRSLWSQTCAPHSSQRLSVTTCTHGIKGRWPLLLQVSRSLELPPAQCLQVGVEQK